MEERTGAFARFLRACALAAGWVLLALMAYTVLDVVLRYVFNAPLRSSVEATQFAMSVIVFLGIAYCGWTGGHVSVDLLEKLLDRPSLRLLPAAMAFLGAALFLLVAWQTFGETLATMDRVTNMTRIPYYPFRFVVVFGAALFALVLFVQGVRSAGRARPPQEPDGQP